MHSISKSRARKLHVAATVPERADGMDPLAAPPCTHQVAVAPAHSPWDAAPLNDGGELAHGRLRLQRRLGQGGTGVVYAALDAERGGPVAVKLLGCREAGGIRRFKREFRSLVQLVHPNLVRLHQLFAENGRWYFTMDLVQGVPFDRWVRSGGELDAARLRAAWLQLVAAVGAIHAAGKLHRDLKPSNVLVGPDGHVTVLDFGLVVAWQGSAVSQTLDEAPILGTPSYMAPEQAAGRPATPASDHYALGVMLFECFTGRLPFEGTLAQVLVAKQRDPAPPLPRELPEALGDLAQLCTALLAHAPDLRPDLTATRQTRSTRAARSRPSEVAAALGPTRPALIGRDAELAVLREAFVATRQGQPRVVFVSGESGVGKTALCEWFLDDVREHDQALALAGRCYERESVPFKMFDSLIDALVRHLVHLPAPQAAALLPRHVFALARMFPALSGVGVVAHAPSKRVVDPHELQQLAFEALHELLSRLGDRQPLVLYLDDLHWTDHDSVGFLRRLLQHPSPVPALIVASHRSEDAAQNPLLVHLLEAVSARPPSSRSALRLLPLSAAAGAALARRLLDPTLIAAGDTADSIAREAGGSPFLTGVLVKFVARGGHRPRVGAFALSAALSSELSAFSDSARRLLQLLALVGQPLPLATALAATAATHTDFDALRVARLTRVAFRGDATFADCYHDRIRECLSALLPVAERRSHYASLARVLLGGEVVDPELVYRCLEGSGQAAHAARFACIAGDRAADTTAFERAAELYAKALATGLEAAAERAPVELKLAASLARIGRGADAAAAYLRAAAALPAHQARGARREAAEALMTCGYVIEGEAILRTLCREVQLPLPAGPRTALAHILYTQCKVRVRGLGFRERPAAALSKGEQLRLDTARAAVLCFVGHRPLYAVTLADRYLALALASGQLDAIANSLGSQAYMQTLASLGPRRWVRARARTLLEQADRVASRGRPESRAFIALNRGFIAVNHGEWREARGHAASALQIYRNECSAQSVAWEIECARLHDQIAAFMRGDFLDLIREGPALIEDSFSRGRLWGGTVASGMSGVAAWLSADDVAGARFRLDYAARRWTVQPEPGWPEYFLTFGQAMCELYCGVPARAHELLNARWAGFERYLLRVDAARAGGSFIRGAAALAAFREAPDGSAAREQLATVERSQRLIARARAHPGAAPMHAVLAAGLALARGDDVRAVGSLSGACAGFRAADMAMYAAAAQRRLGQLTGGDAGRAVAAEASAAMAAQGVVNADAMAEMLCPGLRRSVV